MVNIPNPEDPLFVGAGNQTPDEINQNLEERLSEPIDPLVFDFDNPPPDEDVQESFELDEPILEAEE